MAYVEVKAKTVELAVEAAMRELGVTDRGQLDVKVLQEPERGFLGMGGRDAIVKVEEAEPARTGRRSRNRSASKTNNDKSDRSSSRSGGNRSGGGNQRNRSSGQSDGTKSADSSSQQQRNQKKHTRESGSGRGSQERQKDKAMKKHEDRDPISIEAQEPMVKEFLAGLVGAFGLEGSVETEINEEVIVANVVGEQTEALVGPRGSVLESVHELTKTMLQRSAQDSARVRLDIAGYAERRRQALGIYARDLIEQVKGDGGEIMLEPMSASDRKVIHDAVGEHEGVRSYSEGVAPKRYVVIAPTGDDEAEDAGDDGSSEEE